MSNHDPAPRWPLPGIALGADYNPEQWPEAIWLEDMRLMRAAGVGFATVGVFAWGLLQPEPGRFDFGWLDRVLGLLHENGIAADLATATASPPAWLSRAHPESMVTDQDGRQLWPGSRQNYCPSSPVFREHALALVTAVAERYGSHPAVRMWHVSNELGAHNAHCYCDVSAAAFRRWLQARYGDLSALNLAWGTAFWSQHYDTWDQIQPPRATTAVPNPTHTLDFHRFSSDELKAQFIAERDLLHQLSPGIPVTTNLMVMPHVRNLDYWQWAPELDLVAQDHYLDGALDPAGAQAAELAFCGDVTRGLAGGPWFLMEHSTSAVNWQSINHAKAPGQLLRNSLGHVARGADAVGFFQWRASVAGGEKFHSALLPHAGTDTKVWREVMELGAVLGRASEIAGTRVEARAAILYDWQSGWAWDQEAHPTTLLSYNQQPLAVHRALWRLGITADGVRPGQDLSAYQVVIVPTVYLMDDACVQQLSRFVENGGHLLVTFGSGLADVNDHILPGGYPGALRDLLGIRSEEIFPLAPEARVRIGSAETRSPGADEWSGSIWTELTHLRDAVAMARYLDGPVAGGPAITRRTAGDGAAWYCGTFLDDEAQERLVRRICTEAGLTPVLPAGPGTAPVPGLEAVRRSGAGRSYLFLFNHTTGPVTVPAHGYDLVADADVPGEITLAAGRSAIVREAR